MVVGLVGQQRELLQHRRAKITRALREDVHDRLDDRSELAAV